MGEREIGAFLTHLATEKQVSASTQNQAMNAILFLYRHVLARPDRARPRHCSGKAKPAAPDRSVAGRGESDFLEYAGCYAVMRDSDVRERLESD